MGKTVKELLYSIDSRELSEWKAFFKVMEEIEKQRIQDKEKEKKRIMGEQLKMTVRDVKKLRK